VCRGGGPQPVPRRRVRRPPGQARRSVRVPHAAAARPVVRTGLTEPRPGSPQYAPVPDPSALGRSSEIPKGPSGGPAPRGRGGAGVPGQGGRPGPLPLGRRSPPTRPRLAGLLPAARRLTDGGTAFLRYYSDRVLAAPVEELLDPAFFPGPAGHETIDLNQP